MISKLLVANRGEIARRIAATARSMDISIVAVYAEGDRDAPYVREADAGVALPGATAAETYLDAGAIIEAARASGADAVHPGYGFLSERAELARGVVDAGMTWVGPPVDVIAAMGDKLAAKEIMSDAGVPVLPTWDPSGHGAVYPVLVKATGGGGGRGMRVVEVARDLERAVSEAAREAESAFGDGRVFLERYLPVARHVEIQILGDSHGSLVHCFERECSIQRRHQKVIEEAPSPGIGPDVRAGMTRAAIAAGRAVGYVSAGTVEFLVEPGGAFWFLEMNTRLQVEHPVTEAVTGLDLVREQLRVAAGLPLSFGQEDLELRGHAIEARVYAEDPANGFLPSARRVAEWAPAIEYGARWDSGVDSGTVVGLEFDPMLAKVIVHGETRRQAAASLARTLRDSRIRGVTTNRDFLVAALRHPDFLDGNTTTDFVERTGITAARAPSPEELRSAALAATFAARCRRQGSGPVPRSVPAGFRNTPMPPERVELRHGAETIRVEYLSGRDGRLEASVGSWTGTLEVLSARDGWIELEEKGPSGGFRRRLHVHNDGSTVYVQGPEGDVTFTELPRFPVPLGSKAAEGGLVAPLPGRIVAVHVQPGDEVDQGAVLMIVEAMKMEHRVTAPEAGVVREVRARPGEQVNGGDVLVVFAR